MQLSETLRTIRQKAFLSQEEFAKELSVSASTINRWETGKVKPNLTALKKLSSFCEEHICHMMQLKTHGFVTQAIKVCYLYERRKK